MVFINSPLSTQRTKESG